MDNYFEGCHEELEMTNSLQNASLNGCGYIVLPTMSLVAYLNRRKWVGINDHHPKNFLNVLVRIAVFGGPTAFAAIPAIALKKEMVNDSAIIIMFTNYIIPMGAVAWYTVGGPYDYLVTKAENACGYGRPNNYEEQIENQASE